MKILTFLDSLTVFHRLPIIISFFFNHIPYSSAKSSTFFDSITSIDNYNTEFTPPVTLTKAIPSSRIKTKRYAQCRSNQQKTKIATFEIKVSFFFICNIINILDFVEIKVSHAKFNSFWIFSYYQIVFLFL